MSHVLQAGKRWSRVVFQVALAVRLLACAPPAPEMTTCETGTVPCGDGSLPQLCSGAACSFVVGSLTFGCASCDDLTDCELAAAEACGVATVEPTRAAVDAGAAAFAQTTCAEPGASCSSTSACCQSGSGAPNGAICSPDDQLCHAVCSTSSDCGSGCCAQLQNESYGACATADGGLVCM